jgi:glycosyltransferase involved in cell wall biosynthesis
MEPLVDVNIAVYNHARYLKKTLEGVVRQNTTFPFRVLIGDDCSTDGSVEILQEYERKYPSVIEVIYQRKNLGLSSSERNGIVLLKNSTARYIAILDGDDYWTDPLKLQKQVDFLEKNPTIFGCYHDVQVVDENNIVIRENYYKPHKEVFDQRDCLVSGGTYCTSSLVFRGDVINNMPKWFLRASSDYAIDLLITEYGKIAHIGETMGVYRIHSDGSWQGNSEVKNFETVVRRYQICLTHKKFKKQYGDFFYERIAHLSRYLVANYNSSRQFGKRMKYIAYYIYYTRPKSKAVFAQLFGTMLFPSLYKKLKFLFSKD